MDAKRLERFAREAGADVFGVASVERFDGLAAEKHPRTIFPEARSVIVLGRRITRGTLRGVEEGTNFNDFRKYGADWLEDRFVALTTYRTAEFLEDDGWEAVPLPNLPPEIPPMGVSVRKGQPAPNVMLDFDDAAVRAGVGELGWCGVLLTPDFGPRQRVQMILTDAKLKPTPILRKRICPGPAECKDVCPLGALSGGRKVVLCGKTMSVAKIDFAKCAACKNGAMANRHHHSGRPERLAAVCVRSCVDFLERTGRVKCALPSKFRRRAPWVVRNETDLFRV